jgi:hypothetical protein
VTETTRPLRDRGENQPGLVRMQAVLTRADYKALRLWLAERQTMPPIPAGAPMTRIIWERLRHG